jgi:hypothetical protein
MDPSEKKIAQVSRFRKKISQQQQKGHAIRPHLLSQGPLLALAVLLGVIFTFISIYFPGTNLSLFSFYLAGRLFEYDFPVLQLLPLALVLKAAYSLYNEKLMLERNHVVHYSGILSPISDRKEIAYHSIRALNVKQSYWGHLVDVGEVQVGMTLKDLGYIKIGGVRHPKRVKELLESLAKKQGDGL